MAEAHPVQMAAHAAREACLRIYPLVLVCLVWELVGRSGLVRPLFLPPLSQVIGQTGELLREGEIIEPLVVSLYRAFAGLVLAVVLGVTIGLVMARSQLIGRFLDPLVSFGFPAPKIAFVPIFILWFGIDHLSKILLVAFTCVFPMIVATHAGALTVGRAVLWSAKAMGTPELTMLTRVILPACLPQIFSGIRVTVPVAMITAFTAEMVAGGGGIGASLMFAQRFFQTPAVFVYIIVMLLSGLLCDRLLLAARSHLLRWEQAEG